MKSQQQTLDVIKNRKQSVNEHGLSNKEMVNNIIGINKLSRQLSFDGTVLQIIKKQKVS